MGDVFPPRSNASPRRLRLGPSGSSVMPGPAMKIDSSGEDDQLMSPALALPPPPAGPAPSRKRKKTDDGASGEGGPGGGSGGGGEPRRLRRSHEACARCRAKKIKVSSSHPSSILADVRRRPSVFAALTGCLRGFSAKIITRIIYMHLPCYNPQRASLSSFAILTTPFQCDSLHPRCGSCAAAGVPCQQEDRHRYVYPIRIRRASVLISKL